ncbi:hypothetical protein [Streptomyces sp. DH24]|uniref:hypothetical protein n=1 Tax=Streptomyces sp. DH24 TaxID=3040123 RepID=UPI0024417336|nr:hypothetical protein [Streptomyces sp. DH24]MDG9719267.1 hypothetical protein [Streptomyces sp. DH24]
MFRLVRDAVAHLLGREEEAEEEVNDKDLAREVRPPDPYVWRLPNPYDARWRRWFKRSRAAGHYLPFPAEDAHWQVPSHSRAPARPTGDDLARPYALRP